MASSSILGSAVAEALEDQVDECPESRQPAEVAVVADERVAAGRRLSEIDGNDPRRRVSERPREHREAGAARAEPRLHLAVVAPEGDGRARGPHTLVYPRDP